MRKTITIVGAVVILVLACIAVFGNNITTNAKHYEDRGELTSISGIVRGYTIHNGIHYVIINAISYKIKGITTDDIESIIGSEITMKLIDKGDYYEYIGIEHPIKEEIISMSVSDEDLDILNFCDWLEQKHPILNKFLWGRYNRLKS